jgi:hypothetical protein
MKSYVAVKQELKTNSNLIISYKSYLRITRPEKVFTSKKNGITVQDDKDQTYKLIQVPAGTYRIWNVSLMKNNALLRLTETTSYILPPEFSAVFKVNPGEIVYAGDYIIGQTSADSLDLKYDMEACRQAVVKENPLLDGFMWVPSLADRDSF